jgi:protein disulfide-isomerase
MEYDEINQELFNKYLLYKKKYLKKKMSKMSGGSSEKELILFKASWCGHCKKFLPVWNNITNDSNLNVKFTTYDSDEHKNEMQNYKIEGYPTILYKVNNQLIEYVGSRDEQSVKDFINSY